MANKIIGSKLRELRNKNGFTQQQVADMLGLKNKSTLGNWEIGNSEPDAVTFLKLCDIYNVDDIISEFKNTQRIVKTFPLTDVEKKLVIAYRNHPELQLAINKMLDIDVSNDTPSMSDSTLQKTFRFAARDGKGGIIELSDEQAKKLQDLLESDFPELL